jgi:hypothetical protein
MAPSLPADTLQARQERKRLLNQQRLAARGNTEIYSYKNVAVYPPFKVPLIFVTK